MADAQLGECPQCKDKLGPMSNWLLIFPSLYIVALGTTAYILRNHTSLIILGLPLPPAVLWFGALGGVVASLQGIFFHNRKWDNGYTHWHVFSGIVGAAFGLASYLFLIVIVNSANGAPSIGKGGSAPSQEAVFALGAFALGYGQSQFHAMMDRVFSVLFQPSKVAPQVSKESVDVSLQIHGQKGDLEIRP